MPLDGKLAYSVVDAGASVVVGHHPHVYQSIESYEEALIYYSIGNLYMLRSQKLQGDVGIVLTVGFVRDCMHQVVMLYSVRDRSMETLVVTEEYDLKPTIRALSLPMSSNDRAYEHFFRLNRVRRKGLPVFTGSRLDSVRYVWLDFRSFIVRMAVRLGLR